MTVITLIMVIILPGSICAGAFVLDRMFVARRFSYMRRQVLLGLVFGCTAIICSEYGVPIGDTTVNVREAAPLCAGIIFGGPAGIIAGLIGGVERWFAVLWGASEFTRAASTISTILAGFLGAAVHRVFLTNKKAAWGLGLACSIIVKAAQIMLVFIIHSVDAYSALAYVRTNTVTAIPLDAISVLLALFAVTLLDREKLRQPQSQRPITETFQFLMFVCVLTSFVISSLFTYTIQTHVTNVNTDELLALNLEDVKADIREASDRNLLNIALLVASGLPQDANRYALVTLAQQYQIAEINIVDSQGIIIESTRGEFVGFDMASGEQSGEFLRLLSGTETYVQSYRPQTFDASLSRKYAGVALETGGFIQVGYDAAQFQLDIASQVREATRNRHIGKSGQVIICDENFNVVSDMEGMAGDLSYDDSWKEVSSGENTRFKAVVNGVECFCMYTMTEGYYIVAAMPVSEATFSRDIALYMIIFMEVLVFAAIFIQVFFLLKRLIVDNIHQVNRSLAQITGGNLDELVDVRTNVEFTTLSDDINATVLALKGYIAEAEARIDQELEFARQIQAATLPSAAAFTLRKDFEIHALMDPAKEVGGDFYDFYLLNQNTLIFLVADVSGKGIPAAMFMMTAKTMIKSMAENGMPVEEVFTKANDNLCESNDAGMFVTAWLGALNLQTGQLTYVNAGHNPPLIRRKNGKFEFIRNRPNLVLAGMKSIKYRRYELQLSPGDEVYLYTDGVTEATDANNVLFGEARLLEALGNADTEQTSALCAAVRGDIDRFVGDAPQFDDITMLCVKLLSLEQGDGITTCPDQSSMAAVAAWVEKKTSAMQLPPPVSSRVHIAVDEIYSNIVRFSGATRAELTCRREEDILTLVFADNGAPFDPTARPQPDTSLSLEEREIGGLGIYLVKRQSRSMDYQYAEGKNIVTVTYQL